MKQVRRHHLIREILTEKGAASTAYLSERLGVSEATVRRDVQALVGTDPNLRRVHGGIELRDLGNNLEYMFDLKLHRNVELKVPIAHAAAEQIQPNETVIIDSGSTCHFAATQIARHRGVRIIVVDVKTAEALGRFETATTVVIGGELRPGFYTIGESFAVEMLARMRADVALLGVDGLSVDFGVSNAGVFEVGIKRQILRSAGRVIALCDATKIGNDQPYQVCAIDELDVVITNRSAPAEQLDRIRERNIELVLV